MINAEELTICKRRGHSFGSWGVSQLWKPCRWCGMWVRERRVMEEQEDAPPESERDPIMQMRNWAKEESA